MLNFNTPIIDTKKYSEIKISEIEPILKINLAREIRLPKGWLRQLETEFSKPYMIEIRKFLTHEYNIIFINYCFS